MSETVTTEQPIVYNQSEKFFRKPYNSSIAFAVGILLFLLPFAELKCGSVTIIGNSGLGIATGSSWRVADGWGKNEIMAKAKESAKQGKDMMKDGPNIFALVSLIAAVFGLVISFLTIRGRYLVGMCAGILAATMLLAVLIQFKIEWRSAFSGNGGGEGLGLNMEGVVKIQFTFWYYTSLFSFIAAAFFNFMQDRLALNDAINSSMDFEFQKTKPPI